MKTQIRFGARDVEIMMKKHGHGEPYKKIPYETITEPESIPEFEFNMKWNQRKEQTMRRKLVPYGEATNDMETEDDHPKLCRQRSQDTIKSNDKKQRLSKESSESGSGPDSSGSSGKQVSDDEI